MQVVRAPGPAAARRGCCSPRWAGSATSAWVGARTGEPLGYFRVADGWGNGFDGGRAFAAGSVTTSAAAALAAGRAPASLAVGRAPRAARAGGPGPAAAAAAGVRRGPARAGADHVGLLRLEAALPAARRSRCCSRWPCGCPGSAHRTPSCGARACSRPARRRTARPGCSAPDRPDRVDRWNRLGRPGTSDRHAHSWNRGRPVRPARGSRRGG